MRLTLRNTTIAILLIALTVSVLADFLKERRTQETLQARLLAEEFDKPLIRPDAAERKKIRLYQAMIASSKPKR
jgi:hypothetical protein